jgi:dienelactone hydrolase
LQGADLLAAALDAIVIVPDFFKGKPAQNEWYTNPSEEHEKLKAEFQKGSRNFAEHAKTLTHVVSDAKTKWAQVTSWGAFGLCWGGKVSTIHLTAQLNSSTDKRQVAALASGSDTPFKVSGQVHPGCVHPHAFKSRC